MLYGLRESLNIVEEEGLENIFFLVITTWAEGVRAAVIEGWKLRRCAPRRRSGIRHFVSAIVVPEPINAAQVIDVAFRPYNLGAHAGAFQGRGQGVSHRPPGRLQTNSC